MDTLIRINPVDEPEYDKKLRGLPEACWPEFMLHDAIADRFWHHLVEDFPTYQFGMLQQDGTPVAMVNSVPIYWDAPLKDLPDEGWDWAMQWAVDCQTKGLQPNMLCAIQVAIHPMFRGGGLSANLLGEMRKIAVGKGFSQLIAPVRPSGKSELPNLNMDEYIAQTRPDGLPMDPWLRVHVRAGAKIIKVAWRSMEISGTLADWKNWTGMDLGGEGEHIVPGALSPVVTEPGGDRAIYIEPNVWMLHTL